MGGADMCGEESEVSPFRFSLQTKIVKQASSATWQTAWCNENDAFSHQTGCGSKLKEHLSHCETASALLLFMPTYKQKWHI